MNYWGTFVFRIPGAMRFNRQPRYCTTTVPVIMEWRVQWNGNVPVVLNTVVLLVPDAMSPVFQTPLSLVDVCSAPSLFCQVIVVPRETVIVVGLNAKPLMITVFGWLLPEGPG